MIKQHAHSTPRDSAALFHFQARRGHSLLEAMLVLVILGAIASVTLPRFAGAAPRARANAAAERLAADLERVSEIARARGEEHYVRINEAGRGYQVLRGSAKTAVETVRLATTPYDLTEVDAAITGGGNEIEFCAEGLLKKSGTVTVFAGQNGARVILRAFSRSSIGGLVLPDLGEVVGSVVKEPVEVVDGAVEEVVDGVDDVVEGTVEVVGDLLK